MQHEEPPREPEIPVPDDPGPNPAAPEPPPPRNPPPPPDPPDIVALRGHEEQHYYYAEWWNPDSWRAYGDEALE